LIDSTAPGTPVLISGIPGVGKSELIKQYASLHQRDFEGGLAWVRAETLGESLLAVMQQVKLDQRDLRFQRQLTEQVAEGWRQWYRFCTEQPLERRALVMIEDVTDYQRQVAPFLPSPDCATPFRIVLTSRSQWRGLPTLELWQLEPEEAEAVLRRWAGDNPSVQTSPELVTALCERLGYLPLALTLAGSWLSESERTLSFLFMRLDQEGLGATPLSPDPADIRQQATLGLQTLLEVSWQGLSADAQQLGRVLSLFANADVKWEWVIGAIQDYGDAPRRKAVHLTFWQRLWQRVSGWFGWRPYPRFIELPFAPITEPLESKLTLRRSNWIRVIEVDGQQWLQIHRLLYEFLGQQGQAGDPGGWGLAAAQQLATQAERIPAMAAWEVAEPFQPLRPHLEHILRCWLQLPETPPKQWRNSIEAGAFRLNQIPLFETTYRRAIANHDRAKEALSAGNQALAQQYFTEARDGYQRAVDQARSALPKDSWLLAGYLSDIADFLKNMGQYRAAIPPAREAVAIAERKDNPQKLARYLNQLGIIYGNQGEYEAALPLFELALEISKEQLGERHPDTATLYNNLAGLYELMGQYEAALPLFELALEISKEQLGERHPDTATSYNNLANLYRSMGQYEAALPLYQLALEIWKEELGERHPNTATPYNNLAGLYESMGQYKAALPLYQLAVEIWKEELGERHPSTAQAYNNLAGLYESMGQYEAALPLYQLALAIWKEQLGERHPTTATSYNNLALLYYSMGWYEAALPLSELALEIKKEQLGERHPDTASSYNNLALLYESMGQYEAALPLYELALDIYQTALGGEHPTTKTVRQNYERCLQKSQQ
jgi:tetratricopeptide (TPR) repeat protein